MNNNDELEELLGRELRGQVDGMNTAPLGLGDVKGRASSIRRNRRVGVGVGVAAALAVIVPTALMVGDAANRTQDLDPANPSPSPIGVVHTTLTLDGLERGQAPAVEYFTAEGVVLPDEGLQPLEDSYQALVPSGDTWLALSPARYELMWLDGTFQPTDQAQITENFVSNPDRSWVAYTTVDETTQTLVQAPTNGGSMMSAEFPAAPQVDPVDFVGDGEVLYQTSDSRGRHQTIGISSDDGEVEFEGHFVKAIAANPETGLVSVQTESNADSSGCFGVVEPAVSTAELVWDTCDYSLGGFSPDGRYVLASDPYQSGAGPVSVSVLDARTGDLVASFQPERGGQVTLNNLVWESTDTFLAYAYEGANQVIARFGVDGSLEEAVPPLQGDPFGDQAFYFGADRTRGL